MLPKFSLKVATHLPAVFAIEDLETKSVEPIKLIGTFTHHILLYV